MKKIIALALALAMVFALAACGGGASAPAAAPAAPAASAPAASAPAASAPAASAPAASAPAAAEPAKTLDWPKKDISIVCPFKAGGAMDLSTRLTAKYLEKYLGVSVTVNNVEGGNNWVGYTQVNQAKGDGYLLGFANYPGQVGGYLNPSAGVPLTYRDFTSIADIVHDANVLVVSPKYSPYKTLQEFMDAAKTKSMVVGTGGGAGSDDDVLIRKLNQQFGTQLVSGQNANDADASAALLGGHIDARCCNVSNIYKNYKSTGDDAVLVLAVFDSERSDFIPDIPTGKELGFDVSGSSDRGLIGPPSLDPEITAYLIETLKKIEQDPEFKADAESQGMGIHMLFGDDFAAYIQSVEDTMSGMLVEFGWK